MTCSGCAATVENALASVPHVTGVKVNLDQSAAEISMDSHVEISSLQKALKHLPTYQIFEQGHYGPLRPAGFWQDGNVWNHASLNTLNCLIGCSIGDFAMVMYLQAYFPATSMTIQMILATVAGLITSVMMETVLLRSREKFSWSLAFQTAVSMSFLSMIAMEIAMNTTDFMITGGKAAFENPMYWTALIVAMVAGFLVPLPYNYYKLKKFNKACH